MKNRRKFETFRLDHLYKPYKLASRVFRKKFQTFAYPGLGSSERTSRSTSSIPERNLNLPIVSLAKQLSADATEADRTTVAAADLTLDGLQQELNRIQRSMRLTLQSKLQTFLGRTLGSLELNRQFAKSIQSMLDQQGFRVRCQQCGHPAILRVSPRKGMDGGAFVFDHTIDGRRTFHGGGSTVPVIQLVAKPNRRG